MRLAWSLAPIALLVPSFAHAATCEESFTKSGSLISGQKFGASVTVPGLTPRSAIGQLRGIVLARSYVVMAAEPDAGTMLFEQSVSGKARGFPLTGTATQGAGGTTVTITAKLPIGMSVKTDAAKIELCQMLGALKSGRAGNAAASSGMAASAGGGAPIAMSAFTFSHQISKDTERNPAAAELRYRDKNFVLSGNVGSLDKWGSTYVVMFDIPEPSAEALPLPNAAPFKTDIICKMAPSEAGFYLQLRRGKGIKLSGTYDAFDSNRHVLVLKNCRSAK